ncbi:hypothetical protein FACS1894152_1150 [Bacilli bacterium]|nr:hypothetical protein FACS1894152_1150 [Bacilli bacterium]
MATDKKKNKSAKVILKEIFTNKTVLIALAITLLLLIFFRIGGSVTMPGVKINKDGQNWDENSFAGMMNLLAGGGLTRMSLFAVGVGPYITAQIIVQLLSSDLIKPMSKMAKAGERGRRKLEIITRIITLPFCIAQGYAVLAMLLNSQSGSNPISVFGHSSLDEIPAGQIVALLFIFTAGTYMCIFIGDIITKRGVGNGITLLILAGIVSSIIPNFVTAFDVIKNKFGSDTPNLVITVVLSFTMYVLFFIVVLVAIIFINGSTRKIPIQQTGQGLTTEIDNLPFLPIKLNSAGVIPVIFASSIMTIPGTIAQFLSH